MRFTQQSASGFVPIALSHGEIVDQAGSTSWSVNRWRFDQIGNDETTQQGLVLAD
jgi:hypothetical protein